MSNAFCARLPESITDEQLEKVVKWAHDAFVKTDVVMAGDGAIQLLAVRKEPKTAREFQRNLRTNLVNWGVSLPSKQAGWLQLSSEQKYSEMLRPPGQQKRSAEDTSESEAASGDASSPQSYIDSAIQRNHDFGVKSLQLPANLLTVK